MAPSALTEPPPAQGPGVTVPFAAPPTERDRKRLWITLGVAGGLVLLCVIGGVIGVAVLIASSRVSSADATGKVHDYLDALQSRDYSRAYDDLCAAQQNKRSESEFESSQQDQPDISSYQINQPTQTSDGYDVPASIELVNGQQIDATFGVVLDAPGDLRICSVTS